MTDAETGFSPQKLAFGGCLRVLLAPWATSEYEPSLLHVHIDACERWRDSDIRAVMNDVAFDTSILCQRISPERVRPV